MKKLFKTIIPLIMVLFFVTSGWAAMGLTGGDQLIRGVKTFEHNAIFKKNVTVLGAMLGINQYSSVFWVDSSTGADTGDGESYLSPYATLEYAINKCTADKGDVIFVMPGHNEGITTAAAIDFDVAGITVIGLGTGTVMPTIDFDAAAASVTIGADNVSLYGLRFRTSYEEVVVGLNIEDDSDNALVEGCMFGFAETATDEFLIALQTGDASNSAKILNNEFHGGAQEAVCAIKFNEDTDSTVVQGNWITGSYSTAPVLAATTASTNLLIDGNFFFTAGTTDTFNLVAASTGIVSNNIITMNAVSAAAALDIGNCLSFQNYLIADDDLTGAKAAVEAGTFASVTATADD